MLGAIVLPVQALLAQTELPLAELQNLQPGDIIPLQAAASAGAQQALLVADRLLFRGRTGVANGQLAFQIQGDVTSNL